jgi:hypothetical protein
LSRTSRSKFLLDRGLRAAIRQKQVRSKARLTKRGGDKAFECLVVFIPQSWRNSARCGPELLKRGHHLSRGHHPYIEIKCCLLQQTTIEIAYNLARESTLRAVSGVES